MTITQTVEIPASRRIILDVPGEVPTGTVILSWQCFTDKPAASPFKKPKINEAEEIEYINCNADRLNAEAMDGFSYQVPFWNDETDSCDESK